MDHGFGWHPCHAGYCEKEKENPFLIGLEYQNEEDEGKLTLQNGKGHRQDQWRSVSNPKLNLENLK